MDYSQYTKQTFQLQPNNYNEATAYFTDGSFMTIALDKDFIDYNTVEELEYYCANYVNRFAENDNNTLSLIGCSFTGGSEAFLISTTRIDFFQFSCANTGCSINAVIDYDLNSSIDDYNNIENYSYVTGYGAFSSSSSRGEYTISLVNGQNTIFDYSNLYFENSSYLVQNRVIRGENVAFNNVYIRIGNYDEDNVYFTYGSPYRGIANEEYNRGYGNGYATGYVEGQQEGYELGLASSVDPNTHNAFAYVAQAFNAVGGILEIEVLPHVTLGLCFSIPLILVLIMTIFKLVKK